MGHRHRWTGAGQRLPHAAVGQPRFRAWLLGLFAATAILLAMTGLYGTMAYAVQQRTREIGLRIALGATPRQATALLLRNGLTLAVTGTILGLAGSAVSAAYETAIDSHQPLRLVHELGALPAPRHVLNGYNVGGLITGLQPRASVSYAILKSRVAWQRLIEPTMTVSSPMCAQANGVAATIQKPKAMIPIDIRNENAASMLASIPKKERSA